MLFDVVFTYAYGSEADGVVERLVYALICTQSVVQLALVLEGEGVVQDAVVSGYARKEGRTVAHGILDESLADFDVGDWSMNN